MSVLEVPNPSEPPRRRAGRAVQPAVPEPGPAVPDTPDGPEPPEPDDPAAPGPGRADRPGPDEG
jgi:hypothetical protein